MPWKWDNIKFHQCLNVGQFVCAYDGFCAISLQVEWYGFIFHEYSYKAPHYE